MHGREADLEVRVDGRDAAAGVACCAVHLPQRSVTWISPRCSSPGEPRPASAGSPESARLSFRLAPWQRYARIAPRNAAGQVGRVAQPQERALGIGVRDARRGREGAAVASSTPRARPPSTTTRATSAPVRISAPCSRAASAIIRGHLAHAAGDEAPGHGAGRVGRMLVQQRDAGAGVRRPGERVRDRVPAQRRLHVLRLEARVQVAPRRRRQELGGTLGDAAAAGGAEPDPDRPGRRVHRREEERADRRHAPA